jgi:hypothetical protein
MLSPTRASKLHFSFDDDDFLYLVMQVPSFLYGERLFVMSIAASQRR